jgi:signal recognition particle receptor subunit beta
MTFATPAVRWQDTVASHLPQPLKDSGVPPEYFVLVPATLLAVLLTYTLTRPSSKSAAHLVSAGGSTDDEYTTKRSHNRASTVVLVGLSETGKTSLFSSLVYQTTPATLPSQKLSQGIVAPASLDTGLKPVTLVDVPGHARLRPLVDEHLSQADGLVICVDAVMASKTSLSSRPGDAESITDVADLIHATLTALAKQRARSSSRTAPPSVLVLFTRADLSPLLGGAGAGTDAAKDDKRRAQLLARCRTALESELGQRRANMGLGTRRAGNVKIAGLGKVAEADDVVASGGVFGWIRRKLGLGASGSNVSADAQEEDDEHDDEVVDYIDWAAAQRAQASDGTGIGAAGFSLDRLDEQVVFGGKLDVALASVGKVRSWAQDATPDTDSLADFKTWIADLQS